jgi:hypothetical protein
MIAKAGEKLKAFLQNVSIQIILAYIITLFNRVQVHSFRRGKLIPKDYKSLRQRMNMFQINHGNKIAFLAVVDDIYRRNSYE